MAGVSLSSSGAAIQRGGVGGSGLGEGAELMDEGGLLLLRPLLPVQSNNNTRIKILLDD